MLRFWFDDNLDFDDALNARIWAESPARGAILAARFAHLPVGGWQDRWAAPRLPWVPDLVGRSFTSSGHVLVLGSAYAAFVGEAASRGATLPPHAYASARSASEFTLRFIDRVVRPDATYYRGIATLLDGVVPLSQVLVSDLCRSSFVQRLPDGSFVGGDKVVSAGSAAYDAWVDAGADWTLARLSQGPASVVVALGDVAFRTLQRVVRMSGGAVASRAERSFFEAHPTAEACRVKVRGRVLTVLKVAHPSWANKNDPGFRTARAALATLLGVTLSDRIHVEVPRASTRPAEPRVTHARQGRVVGLHFVCRGHKNVRDLSDGTFETGVWVVAPQHAQTVEYVALHETQAEPSYRQGRVLGFRVVEHEGRERIVFRVEPDRVPRGWEGEGKMEKSYRWG